LDSYKLRQESPAVTKGNALPPIQLLLQYWPSRSSKVDDFHFIWNSACHFLLAINSNLGLGNHISHRFRDMGSFPLKTHIFPTPPPFNLEFENVTLALDHWNFTCWGLKHRHNYLRKKCPIQPTI